MTGWIDDEYAKVDGTWKVKSRKSTTNSCVPVPGSAAHPKGAERRGTGSREAQHFVERFEPCQEPYLADPYPCVAEARAATPVFSSPDLDSWVVTRDHDLRQIFHTPTLFSAANTLAPLQPLRPAAGHLLAEGGFRPVPGLLTDNDPPGHTRVRRLTNVACTPRRVAAMESCVRELTARFVAARLTRGRADLGRELAWDLPAQVIFGGLGIPDEDVARVKAGAESRLRVRSALLPGGAGWPASRCAWGSRN